MTGMIADPTYLLEGMAEVMGGDTPKPEPGVSIEAAINGCIDLYGPNCARGVVQRAGRAGLYYWLRDHAEPSGWLQPEFRLLSFRRKVSRGIGDITAWLSGSHLGSFQVDERKDKIIIRYHNPHPVSRMDCAFFLGLFQEYFSWIASGKFFSASEVECSGGQGGTHVFELSLVPLD